MQLVGIAQTEIAPANRGGSAVLDEDRRAEAHIGVADLRASAAAAQVATRTVAKQPFHAFLPAIGQAQGNLSSVSHGHGQATFTTGKPTGLSNP